MELHDQQYEERIAELVRQTQEQGDKIRAHEQTIGLLQRSVQDKTMFKTQQGAIDKVLQSLEQHYVKDKVVQEVKQRLHSLFQVSQEHH